MISRKSSPLSTLRQRFAARPTKWRYLVGASVVGVCALASGIAVAATSLDSLDEMSGGGGSYTFSCDVTITGTHAALTLTEGVTCVLNAHITGGISVASGASVIIQHSTISGSITESNPDGTQICRSMVNGGIAIAKSTGFVLVGDPANGCGANTVVGSILATDNHAGLVIVGNKVSGTVTATNNSGAGPLPGQTGPIVSGNHH